MKKLLIATLIIFAVVSAIFIPRYAEKNFNQEARLASLDNQFQAVIDGVDHKKAIRIAQAMLKILPADSPDAGKAWAKYGTHVYFSGHPLQAIKAITLANKLCPDSSSVIEANVILADAYREIGEDEKAELTLKDVEARSAKVSQRDKVIFMGMMLGVEDRLSNQ